MRGTVSDCLHTLAPPQIPYYGPAKLCGTGVKSMAGKPLLASNLLPTSAEEM